MFKNFLPRTTFLSDSLLYNLDHSYGDALFASSGPMVQVWSYERSKPIQSFNMGVDTVTKLKFNPSQYNVIASTAMDRSVNLYDIRGNTLIHKLYMKNKSSAICWNPQEPINVVIVREGDV